MSGDWQCDKSVTQCHQYMLDHEINTDVTFIIDNKEDADNTGSDSVCCKAHKYMLASRSPVFDAMFYGEMAEEGDSIVEDTKPQDFKQLLKYIYTDAIEFHPTNVYCIMYLSKKYIIPQLTRKCNQYIHRILTPDNACLILDQSLIYDDQRLIVKCLKIIEVYTEQALNSETMLDVRQETMLKILDCDIFTMKEQDVFKTCMRWARHQLVLKKVEATGENIRNVLGDCIPKIGYANMGIENFRKFVVPAGVLSMEEENVIFRNISSKDPALKNNFGTKRKHPLQFIISDEKDRTEVYGITLSNFVVGLTSNIDIEITSLFLGCCFPDVMIKDVHFHNTRLNVTEKVDVDGKIQEWKLGSPIKLKKDQKHTLHLEFEYANLFDTYSIYAIKRSEIVANDKIVKMKLTSNASFLPVIGFKYTLDKVSSNKTEGRDMVGTCLSYTAFYICTTIVLIYVLIYVLMVIIVMFEVIHNAVGKYKT